MMKKHISHRGHGISRQPARASRRQTRALFEALDRANAVLIPLVPSVIDLHATGNFLRELMAMGRMKTGNIRVAVVANKVRRSMPAYPPLQQLLDALGLKLLARLIDSDIYMKTAETGAGIFEMNAAASAECKQFLPIAEWVAQEPRLAEAAVVCDLARTRAA